MDRSGSTQCCSLGCAQDQGAVLCSPGASYQTAKLQYYVGGWYRSMGCVGVHAGSGTGGGATFHSTSGLGAWVLCAYLSEVATRG